MDQFPQQLPQTPTPLPELPPAVVATHKPFAWKFFAWVIVIFLAAAVAYLYIQNWSDQYSQVVLPSATQNPTAGWQTYSNSKYGFELKYPIGWRIESCSRDDRVVINGRCDSDGQTIAINISKESEFTKFVNYMRTTKDVESKSTIAGISALHFTSMPEGGTSGVIEKGAIIQNYLFIKDHNFFQINFTSQSVGGNQPIDRDWNKTFNLILSTFKFTNTVADTSTWKTYANTKYNYSIKYPTNWKLETTNSNTDITPQSHPGYQESGGAVRILAQAFATGGQLDITPPDSLYKDAETWHFIDLKIAKPDPAITIDQFITNYPDLNIGHIYNQEEIKIGDKSATRFSSGNYVNTLVKDYSHNRIYLFVYFRQSENDLQDQIIQSLIIN